MPTLTPPTPWEDGSLTNAAMLDAKVNALISELQLGTARGVVYDATATAPTNSSANSYVPVPGIDGTLSVDSPRLLMAAVYAPLQADTVGGMANLEVLINGVRSIYVQYPFERTGPQGQFVANFSGRAVPVNAGTVTVAARFRRQYGSGTVTCSASCSVQILDVGAS